MKNTVIFYQDWYEALQDLTPEERLEAYDSVMRYAFEGVVPKDRFIRTTTALMRTTIDRDNARYDETSRKRKEAVNKRWQAYKRSVMNTNDTNHTDNVKENVNVNDNDKDNEPTTNVAGDKDNKEKKTIEKKKVAVAPARFQRPKVEDVAAYCKERGNYVDPQHFIDFYESKGWKVGNSPMKDWQAAVRTWEQHDGRGRRPVPKGVKLGPGEWIEQGVRRYGSGHEVPMSAPPRPNEGSYWSAENNQWVSGV